MPARQKQNARFLFPTAPAHPIASQVFVPVHLLHVAAAARFGIVRRVLLFVLDLDQDLFKIGSKGVGLGFIGVCQIPPHLVFHRQRFHSLLQCPVQLSNLFEFIFFCFHCLQYVFLHCCRHSPGESSVSFYHFHPHFLPMLGDESIHFHSLLVDLKRDVFT